MKKKLGFIMLCGMILIVLGLTLSVMNAVRNYGKTLSAVPLEASICLIVLCWFIVLIVWVIVCMILRKKILKR